MKKVKNIVMLGTSLATKGGISSVVQVYKDCGLFSRFPLHYIATHCDGGGAAKLRIMLCAYLQLLGMLVTGKVGLVHIHVASRASFWRKYGLFQLAHLFGVPSILHLHGGGFATFYEKECGPVKRWLIRRLYDNVSQVLVLSQQWQTWARSISRNPRISALYNPVIAGAAPADWAGRDAASVLTLGRLNKGKGSYDLLAAAAAMPEPVRLLLGGDGELEQVRQRGAELGLGDRLELLGWVGPEDKPDYLARATLYALPSYAEGLPMSVLEAMAAGMPVITTPVGGIPDVVTDGVEGFLVQPGDVQTLREKLQLLLRDPELAQRMGAAGRRKIETTFARTVVMPRLEQIYIDLGSAQR
jgi:glycosyltransferase involved in cell wall biosynthesis